MYIYICIYPIQSMYGMFTIIYTGFLQGCKGFAIHHPNVELEPNDALMEMYVHVYSDV